MDWSYLGGIGVTGVLVSLVYQAVKGNSWPAQVNIVVAAVIAFLAGYSGVVDSLPNLQVAGNALGVHITGTGADGILAAIAGTFSHGKLLKGTPLGKAIRVELLPRILGLTSEVIGGLATVSKNEEANKSNP